MVQKHGQQCSSANFNKHYKGSAVPRLLQPDNKLSRKTIAKELAETPGGSSSQTIKTC